MNFIKKNRLLKNKIIILVYKIENENEYCSKCGRILNNKIIDDIISINNNINSSLIGLKIQLDNIINDKIKELDKQKKNLFLSSRKFYLYNKEKGIINKIRQYKSKNIGEILKQNGLDFNSKKLNLYSELKRLPTEICFGKGVALMKKEEEDKEIYENKFKNTM